MAEYKQSEGWGNLFLHKKESESQPDFRGQVLHKGEMLKVAVWKKQTVKGDTYLAFKIEDDSWKDKNQQSYPKEVTHKPYDSDVPF